MLVLLRCRNARRLKQLQQDVGLIDRNDVLSLVNFEKIIIMRSVAAHLSVWTIDIIQGYLTDTKFMFCNSQAEIFI